MMDNNFSIRIATPEDVGSIEALMKRSMRTLGMGYYSKQQIESCCTFVCVPDMQLIEDKTFFVAMVNHETIIGCGGWSFRRTLCAGPKAQSLEAVKLNPLSDKARIRAMFVDPEYGGKGIGSLILSASEKAAIECGFTKGTLVAMLSGLSFYKARKWESIKEESLLLPDGVSIGVVTMEKSFL